MISGVRAGACRRRPPECAVCRPWSRSRSAAASAHPLVDLGALGRVEQAEQHLAEAFNRVGPGLTIGAREAGALAVGQLALELDAALGEPQPPLAAIAWAALLLDVLLFQQILQHAADRLL